MKFTQLLDELIKSKTECSLSNDPRVKYYLTDYDKDFKVISLETIDGIPCFLSLSAVVGFIVDKDDDKMESVFISIINEEVLRNAIRN